LEKPLVSIIILNYNGAEFLPICLEALYNQTYDKSYFDVIVSDNGSNDDSIPLLKENYPWVKIIENKSNLGFSRGNNVAIQSTTSDFVVLLNNDTAPAKEWLENLLKVALDHPEAGMVTAHLQLFYDQIELILTTETITSREDPRQLGVQFFRVDHGISHGVVQYLDGFYGWEEHPTQGCFRWMSRYAKLGIPVPPGNDSWEITLYLSAGKELEAPINVEVEFHGNPITQWQLVGKGIEMCHLVMPAFARQYAQTLEQNAGSIVFRSGAGRDRGTYVKDNELFFEVDQGQYNKIEEVFAGCGASLLLRRNMLNEIGSLDDDFFMYYEDTDLSWRARLFGWKVLFAPQAKVRHIHCGTTKEWSSDFIFLTERNRLAMVYKNGSITHVLRVWFGYGLKVFNMIFQTLIRLLLFRPTWRQSISQIRPHLRVIFCLFNWLPALCQKRIKIMSHRRISPKQLEAWFMEES